MYYIGGIIIYTHLEDYINNLYKNLSINHPDQLGIKLIATQLRLNIYYGSVSFRLRNNIIIKKSTEQKEWQSFGHEVAHHLRHVGNHLPMYPLFRDLQENQANYFSYHFCVPTFMLEDMNSLSVFEIMNAFTVEYEFAEHRLNMYQNKMYREGMNSYVLRQSQA